MTEKHEKGEKPAMREFANSTDSTRRSDSLTQVGSNGAPTTTKETTQLLANPLVCVHLSSLAMVRSKGN